jgi:hypothetical protein
MGEASAILPVNLWGNQGSAGEAVKVLQIRESAGNDLECAWPAESDCLSILK